MHKLPWNHNNHYHDLLLAHVPPKCGVALDIGCGVGEFASRLAQRCDTVEAIDPDQQVIDHAHKLWTEHPNISWHAKPFDGDSFAPESYDFVSAIASLHHMELSPTVAHMKRILKPGGVLAILGLYKEATMPDLLFGAAAVPTNFVYRFVHSPNPPAAGTNVPVTNPKESLRDICTVMDHLLPGCRFKRHLLWRYSVIWQKPKNPLS